MLTTQLDLFKGPLKEVAQSPKNVIILSCLPALPLQISSLAPVGTSGVEETINEECEAQRGQGTG